MVGNIFEYSSYDCDDESEVFYTPRLVVPVGNFPVGTQFEIAEINLNKQTLSFYNYGAEVEGPHGTTHQNEILIGRFEVKLQIVKDLLNDE
jgi:hypothetical protein